MTHHQIMSDGYCYACRGPHWATITIDTTAKTVLIEDGIFDGNLSRWAGYAITMRGVKVLGRKA